MYGVGSLFAGPWAAHPILYAGMVATDIPPILVGPIAGLAISLLGNILFQTGKILPRNTVPREDYKQLQDVNASQADGLRAVTSALNELVTMIKYNRGNDRHHDGGGPSVP